MFWRLRSDHQKLQEDCQYPGQKKTLVKYYCMYRDGGEREGGERGGEEKRKREEGGGKEGRV